MKNPSWISIIMMCSASITIQASGGPKHRIRASDRRHQQLLQSITIPTVQTKKRSSGQRDGPQSRIVGGSSTQETDFDYFVHFGACGGSLIARDLVMTAAHCDSIQQNTVRVGAHSRIPIDGDSVGITRTISQRFVHPDWNSSTFCNDFMIMQLDEPVPIDLYRPVSINRLESVPRKGQNLTVIGFGSLQENGAIPDTLQEVEIDYIPQDECISDFHFADLVDEDLMICAGVAEGGKDSCQGDSGGPLVIKNGNGTDILVGIVSWGLGCARPNQPGIYSKVSSAKDWIMEMMCKHSVDAPSRCPGKGTSMPLSSQPSLPSEISVIPSPSPSDSPSSSETRARSIVKSSSGEMLVTVQVEVTTDQYPKEVSYSIRDQITNLEVAKVPFAEFTTPHTVELRSYNLIPGRAYVFRIADASADGICCRYGNGGYSVIAEMANNDGDVGGDKVVLVQGNGKYYGSDEEMFFVPDTALASAAATIVEASYLTIEIDLDSSPPEQIGWSLQAHSVHIESRPTGYYADQSGTVLETILIPPSDADLTFGIIMGGDGGYFNVYRGENTISPQNSLLISGGDSREAGTMVVHTISRTDLISLSSHTLDSDSSVGNFDELLPSSSGAVLRGSMLFLASIVSLIMVLLY